MAAIILDRQPTTQPKRPPLRLVTAPPSRRRPSAAVYRRRRLVAALVFVALVAVAGATLMRVATGAASAGAAPSAPVVLVAQPGDSYWTLAREVSPGGDLRSTVDALVDANGGRDLQAGDRIELAP